MRMFDRRVIAIAVLVLLMPLAGCLNPDGDVNRPAPVVHITLSSSAVNVSEPVLFSGINTTPAMEIETYLWDFGDGINTTGIKVSHVYHRGGDYVVHLIVTDIHGKRAIKAVKVHVNELPIPVIRYKEPARVNTQVTFKGGDSRDPDGAITDHIWKIDGNTYTGAEPVHTFKEVGMYDVYLTVIDDFGATNTTMTSVEVELRKFRIDWEIESENVRFPEGEETENIQEGESEEVSQGVSRLNLTKVEYRLYWQDDIPIMRQANDVFSLEVVTPYGTGKNTTSMDGEIALNFPDINSLPQSRSVLALSPDDLLPEETTDRGVGMWLANVTLVSAPGAIDVNATVGLDGANEWYLMVTYYYYVPVVTELE